MPSGQAQHVATNLRSAFVGQVATNSSAGNLRFRFAAVRVRPAHHDEKRTEPRPEEWLLMEWPKQASKPTKYWLSNLPVTTSLKSLAKLAKHRWVIERDYEELKQELGFGTL